MHLWATDFRVLTAGRRTPFQCFLNFHRRLCLNQSGFFTRGGIYPFFLCPTHIFFMLCNHETHFGRCPITELTTHSPRIMNDYYHAHTHPKPMNKKLDFSVNFSAKNRFSGGMETILTKKNRKKKNREKSSIFRRKIGKIRYFPEKIQFFLKFGVNYILGH